MPVGYVTLRDAAGAAEARILAGFGFNCYRLRMPFGDRQMELVWSEAGFARGDRRASGSGIPILFPYPGRIAGKTLRWRGRTFPLEGDDGRGNAIHGFVLHRPWRVIEQEEHRVVGQFQASADDPDLLRRWPADFRVTATYELSATAFEGTFLVENPADRPLPCGLGLHPYFRLPLGGSTADACRVQLPVSQRWEMIDMLPTGRLLPVEDADRYRTGLTFGDMAFDDVFTGLAFHQGRCTCRVIDPESGCRLAIEFDDQFANCVVYNPPHREAVCIEPYTCVPNAIALSASGVAAGLMVLEPGESFQAKLGIRLE